LRDTVPLFLILDKPHHASTFTMFPHANVKPLGKPAPGKSTLHHMLGSKGEFERRLDVTSQRLGEALGRSEGLKARLDELNGILGDQTYEAAFEEHTKLMHELLQRDANDIDDRAQTLRERIEFLAPVEAQVQLAELQTAIHAQLVELFTGDNAIDRQLVKDTMMKKVKLQQQLEGFRVDNEQVAQMT
jgi:hypothetical protein